MYSSLSISRDCFRKQVLEPHVFEASARAARKASVSLACKITLHTACQEYVTPGLRQRAGQHLRDMKTRAAGQSQVNATASASDRNGHCLSPRLPLPSPFSPGGRAPTDHAWLPDWISRDSPSEYWPVKQQTQRALAALSLRGSLRPFQATPWASNELRQARRIDKQTSAVWRAESSGCQAPAAVSGARRCRAV